MVVEDNGDEEPEGVPSDNYVDGTTGVVSAGGGRKPMKAFAVLREKANEQQRQLGKVGKNHPSHDESKKLRLPSMRVSWQTLGRGEREAEKVDSISLVSAADSQGENINRVMGGRSQKNLLC
uniref:Uncharacterized protein n=1 Tax=Pelodiscus sinensis TaxID=13735 RepID=K7G5G0_PELSI